MSGKEDGVNWWAVKFEWLWRLVDRIRYGKKPTK